jgi:hypothetical protein
MKCLFPISIKVCIHRSVAMVECHHLQRVSAPIAKLVSVPVREAYNDMTDCIRIQDLPQLLAGLVRVPRRGVPSGR